jgi:hypothetical protein
MRKLRWISRTVRKRGEYIDKRSTGLKSAGNRKERKTEAKLEEDRFLRKQGNVAKSWSEVKRLAATASGGGASQMPCVPKRTKGNTVCPTTYQIRHFFNNSNTNDDFATKFEQEYVRCVRNVTTS